MSSGVNKIHMTTTKAFRVHHKDCRETNTGVTRRGGRKQHVYTSKEAYLIIYVAPQLIATRIVGILVNFYQFAPQL